MFILNKMYEYLYRYLGGEPNGRCSRASRDCNIRAFRAPFHAASTCPPKLSPCLPVDMCALIFSVLEFFEQKVFPARSVPFFCCVSNFL